MFKNHNVNFQLNEIGATKKCHENKCDGVIVKEVRHWTCTQLNTFKPSLLFDFGLNFDSKFILEAITRNSKWQTYLLNYATIFLSITWYRLNSGSAPVNKGKALSILLRWVTRKSIFNGYEATNCHRGPIFEKNPNLYYIFLVAVLFLLFVFNEWWSWG